MILRSLLIVAFPYCMWSVTVEIWLRFENKAIPLPIACAASRLRFQNEELTLDRWTPPAATHCNTLQHTPPDGASLLRWSQSLILFSRSLLQRCVEKRPMRLRLEIEIEWHSKCNRLCKASSLSLTHTHTLSHTHTHSHTLSLSHTNALALSVSHTLTHIHWHAQRRYRAQSAANQPDCTRRARSISHIHARTHSLTHSLSLTHTHILPHTLSNTTYLSRAERRKLELALSHTHSISLTHSLSLFLSHTLPYTHTHTTYLSCAERCKSAWRYEASGMPARTARSKWVMAIDISVYCTPIHKSCHVWRSRVKHEWVMSHMNESCHYIRGKQNTFCFASCDVWHDSYMYM